jgi:hypothetical protein
VTGVAPPDEQVLALRPEREGFLAVLRRLAGLLGDIGALNRSTPYERLSRPTGPRGVSA